MSACRPGPANSRNATRPSVLAPTSMTARSFSMPTTVPLTTAPSCGLPWAKDSSSIFAKSSRDGVAELTAVAMNTPQGTVGAGLSLMAFRAQGPKVEAIFGSRRKAGFAQAAIYLRATVRARDPAIKTMILRPCATKEAGGAGSSSMSETRSAAFPACSDGFDDVDGGPERGVYIQMCGVEQVRIRRCFQGGHRPLAVALVPATDVGQDVGLVDAIPLLPQLEGATARAHLRRCGDEDLHVRVGEDDGSDVATVEHGAGGRASETALKRQHCLAHLGDGRDQRSRRAHRLALERRRGQTGGIDRLGRRHRAIDQPGVEVAQAIVGGKPLAERPLARGRRPVDGDDHERSAPRARIKAEKLGKLVAIMAASSTRTGFSLAKPMTRNAMAMRWSMWVVTVPAPAARPLPCTIRSSRSISKSTPLAARPAATAASRSDSFTRNSLSPRMTVVP